VFGDATHVSALTKILTKEMGIDVICSGTYCKHDAQWFKEMNICYSNNILITEDNMRVADTIKLRKPHAIFGTQMERHVGKRLGIPCSVISSPVHIQNFTLSYKPFLGWEGTNQITDLIYNSFRLGMEDHLLEFFGGHDTKLFKVEADNPAQKNSTTIQWDEDAMNELNNIPIFVRLKVKQNIEKYVINQKLSTVTLDLMYEAKQVAQK
jgi:light-independent protochlorophyllide reductase subunit B